VNRTLRRVLHAAALSTALTMVAPLAATAAHADGDPATVVTSPPGPQTTDPTAPGVPTVDAPGNDVLDDATIEGLDLVTDAASGCLPSQVITPHFAYAETAPPPGSSSTYYRESGTGTFTVGGSCRAGVKIVVCLTDASLPAWRIYRKCAGDENPTGRTVDATAAQDVPYLGPDAGIVRPFGDITLRIRAWNKRSDGRYSASPVKCLTVTYVFNPQAGAYSTNTQYDCASAASDPLVDTILA
jgi:hypothetical protein